MSPLPRPKPSMAMCPRCNEPLISTFAWAKFEFYCLCCGAHVDFMGPRAAESTPEVEARHAELQAEWEKHAGKKLLVNGWYNDCDQCKERGSYHPAHATEEEVKADKRARLWLENRRVQVRSVFCSQWASCGWKGKRKVGKLGKQPAPCPKCGKTVTA